MKRYQYIKTGLILQILLLTSISYADTFDAQLAWSNRVELSPLVKGVVAEIKVKAGDMASKGETLLLLDPRAYLHQVNERKAQVLNFQSIKEEVQRELERATEMYDRTLLSEHDFQVAKNNATMAEANLRTARANLEIARLKLEYSTIRAPFDAIILQVKSEVGQSVVPDLKPVTLLVVAMAETMRAEFWVDANTASSIQQGQQAEVTTGGKNYPGKVSEIGLEVAPQQPGKYRVVVEFKKDENILRAGLQAKVKL